jgi:hypothetical protein
MAPGRLATGSGVGSCGAPAAIAPIRGRIRKPKGLFKAAASSYTLPLGRRTGVRMKFHHIASLLLAVALAGCGSLSLTGTPEIATSLNGFRASHGLSQLRTDGTLAALASEHSADMARRDSLDHDGCMTSRGPRVT